MDWKKKLKFAAIVAAFAVLIIIVLSSIFQTTRLSEKDLRTYKQGLAYLNKNDLENAYYNFNNVSKNSAIYEIALFRQAMCADSLNDFETVVKKMRIFLEKYPDSVFAQKANYLLAQNYYKFKDYTKSEKVFNNIRKDFKDSDYAKASNYYLGLIYQNRALEKKQNPQLGIFPGDEKEVYLFKHKAKEYFVQYLILAENGRFALDCAHQIVDLDIDLSCEEYFLLGRTFYKNGEYIKAYEYLAKSDVKKAWGYWAEVHKKRGEYRAYREIVEKNYPLYSENIAENDLQVFLDNYVSLYRYGAKQGWEKLLELSKTTNAKGQDYILYNLAKYVDKSEQLDIYEKIYLKFPNGKFASFALENLFWHSYSNKKYSKAVQLGYVHVREYPNTIAAPKITFWMGKVLEKQGRKNEARSFYQKVLDYYPDDYYAFRASKQLGNNPNNSWKTKSAHKLSEKPQWIEFPYKQISDSPDVNSVINTIVKLNDYKLLGEIDYNNKALQSWLLYAEGKYSTAATLARDYIAEKTTKPSFSDNIYKLAYQLHYQDIINYYSKSYRLDPYFITALIREESYFNPQAGSSVGARGLMQLMPTTALFIAQRNGIPYKGADSLYNPQTNIYLGCAYFDYTKERLHEDDMLATASYNGGPNAVQFWKENLEYKNFDEFIENIPYAETRDYVKKVYRSYWVYLNIY